MPKPNKNDPRDKADHWDAGWENAIDEGEGIEDYLLQAGDDEFRSERGYHVREFDQALEGKNEPNDTYLS